MQPVALCMQPVALCIPLSEERESRLSEPRWLSSYLHVQTQSSPHSLHELRMNPTPSYAVTLIYLTLTP